MSLTICALIAARNEQRYLRVLLPLLAAQRIDAYVIDHGSDDGSDALWRQHAGAPVIGVLRIAWTGVYPHATMLAAKHRIAAHLPHDWVVHHDADEVLEHAAPAPTLRDAIERADAAGCNALNFDEFVFLPYADDAVDDHRDFLDYYHFAPSPNRLNRAWRRAAALDNQASGGHRLEGAHLRLWPHSLSLHHYIGLSQQHLRRKYLTRRYGDAELARGWHSNRIGLDADALTLPPRTHPALRRLPARGSTELRRDAPQALHFWQWQARA